MTHKTIFVISLICSLVFESAKADMNDILNYELIENLTGAKGEYIPSAGVFKIIVPHDDIKVVTAGIRMTPDLGLISWAAFKQKGESSEVDGNVIVFEDQVNSVIKAALDNGLTVRSLHNNYLWDKPRMMVMHFDGTGSLDTLATGVGKVIEVIQKTRQGTVLNNPFAAIDTQRTQIDIPNLESSLGTRGKLKNGVFKVAIGTNKTPEESDKEDQSWAVFAGSNKQAMMMGQMTLKPDEAQSVLKSLIHNNVLIFALHQHLKENNKGTVVVQFMKQGPALELAEQLKQAQVSTDGTGSHPTDLITTSEIEPPVYEKPNQIRKP